jgi:8-oxo-dGTP pyrophosphatase MutT (NUDIX family)
MPIEINSEVVTAPPLPSATVMVLRDGHEGPEVLMLRRHSQSAVLGGAHVFPGGKLDPQDFKLDPAWLDQPAGELQATLAEPNLDTATASALYLAALRETFEECGLLLGAAEYSPQNSPGTDPTDFASLLAFKVGLIPTKALRPWSRWITPRVPSVTNKRFDTRFFVAQAPAQQAARHDEHETTESIWWRPGQALQQYWDLAIELAPPQIMSLSHLSHFSNVAEIMDWASTHPPALIQPEPFDDNGTRVICYPGDPRHSEHHRQRPWPGPTRLSFRNRRFEPDGGLQALLA